VADAGLLERRCSGGLEDGGTGRWAGGREDDLDLERRQPGPWPCGAADVRMSHGRTGHDRRECVAAGGLECGGVACVHKVCGAGWSTTLQGLITGCGLQTFSQLGWAQFDGWGAEQE
jgi:hypothetical protein